MKVNYSFIYKRYLGPELRIIHGDELMLIKSSGIEQEAMEGHVTKIPDSAFAFSDALVIDVT